MSNCPETNLYLGLLSRWAGLSTCSLNCELLSQREGSLVPAGSVLMRMRRRWSRRAVIGRIRFGNSAFVVRGERRIWHLFRRDTDGIGVTVTFLGRWPHLGFGPVQIAAGNQIVDVRLPLVAQVSHEATFQLHGAARSGCFRLTSKREKNASNEFPPEGSRLFAVMGGIDQLGDAERQAVVSGMLSLLLFAPCIRDD